MRRNGAVTFDSRPAAALAVAVVTAVGLAIRLVLVRQSLFADELATYWDVANRGLGGVVSTVHSDAEITPPLYFVVAWLTTRVHLAPELFRAPSLVAGTAGIPIAYLLGRRTVGRPAAVVAAGLVALSPFMILYSTEARGYSLAMTLVMLSGLAMLKAVDGGRVRWWVLYGVCSCGAVYTHYTAAFVLAAQLGWLLWAEPRARRAALLANAGAAVAFLPWVSGFVNDLNSPTTAILSALEPFTLEDVRISLEHWSVGYPYAIPTTTVGALPGNFALVLLGLGLAGAVTSVVRSRLRRLPRYPPGPGRGRLALVALLALAAPLGEAAVSTVSTNLFGTRNLAVSWPGLALGIAAILFAAGRRVRYVAVTLVLVSFAIAAAKMLEARFGRPDEQAVARFIEHRATPGDVVIDGVVVSPGPINALEVSLRGPTRLFRAGQPEERDHPFGFGDRVPPIPDVAHRAAAAARGRRIFLVSHESRTARGGRLPDAFMDQAVAALPSSYRRVEAHVYPGIIRLTVSIYARGGPRRR
jgi:hypothetical protein